MVPIEMGRRRRDVYTMTRLREKLTRCVASICVSAALAVAAVAVTGSAPAQAEPPFQTLPSGLQYRDLQVGTGPAAAVGDVAQIHFVGWLNNRGVRGDLIYNSREHGRSVSFVVGTELVMEGWNQAVVGMRAGGRRMVLIPPELAYGDREIDDVIPAHAHLMMIIELLSVEKHGE